MALTTRHSAKHLSATADVLAAHASGGNSMLTRYRNRVAVAAGVIALLAIGASPASAAMNTCLAGTPAFFTGSTVYLELEGVNNVWSSPVTLYAYCGSVDQDHLLANVAVTGVLATSAGSIPQLEATADGSDPSAQNPPIFLSTAFPGMSLPTPAGLATDAGGKVTFTLRAYSPAQAILTGPDGAPQLIGLQLDYGSGTGTYDVGNGPQTYQYPVGGFGGLFAATPELDSLALFGSGALGLAGYGLMRMRARRRS
jgi:hypothetical protein